ncbi:unnamed protein product [Phytophthora lilii]|uniref:Unnamed protein product n=1 Tax=Phytophthora lilii TaxID=2077276 RepID=A0A9W6TBB2_9STRA|nr:unnamed protein product [Phytophthora lilii]
MGLWLVAALLRSPPSEGIVVDATLSELSSDSSLSRNIGWCFFGCAVASCDSVICRSGKLFKLRVALETLGVLAEKSADATKIIAIATSSFIVASRGWLSNGAVIETSKLQRSTSASRSPASRSRLHHLLLHEVVQRIAIVADPQDFHIEGLAYSSISAALHPSIIFFFSTVVGKAESASTIDGADTLRCRA